MFSIQQLIKVLQKLQSSKNICSGDLVIKTLKNVSVAQTETSTNSYIEIPTDIVTSFISALTKTTTTTEILSKPPNEAKNQQQQQTTSLSTATTATQQHTSSAAPVNSKACEIPKFSIVRESNALTSSVSTAQDYTKDINNKCEKNQRFKKNKIHQSTLNIEQNPINLYQKEENKQNARITMSSLAAAETLTLKHDDVVSNTNGTDCCSEKTGEKKSSSSSGKPCFNTGLAEILKFMELIGNLKHTKRTGWVLRDVNDCESISGHMYRMSMMTFLLDGTEGLNQIRCMELALVHDLAESLVGDITPFCGVTKDEKRTLELKAMEDICKLIEPRGKRIMELFTEYEHGQSAESKFVKDLDRLDMVMQAFEYEKRDNCLLKHQEFFDSTEGKFNHPFVKKLVNEIYEQRQVLASTKGATPPPVVHVPNMEDDERR